MRTWQRTLLTLCISACSAFTSQPELPSAHPEAPTPGHAASAPDDALPAEISPLPLSPSPVPTPPFADAPWTAPEGTPEGLELLARQLFDLGLPDPRGCEYRAIAIHVGLDAWDGDQGIVRTRGWVLPAEEGSTRRWAIAHNGMLYAVAALGRPIPLERAALGFETRPPVCVATAEQDTHYEHRSVECRFGVIAVVLALRVGRLDLALDVEGAAEAPTSALLGLAWDARARALGAHIRGDDVVALHAVQLGVAARDEAFARGVARDLESEFQGMGTEGLLLMDALLADQERRAREAAESSPAERDGADADRISLLIAGLDELRRDFPGASGSTRLGPQGPEGELRAIGWSALDSLIDTVEHDARLTRTVLGGRDWSAYRSILSVAEVAEHVALQLLSLPSPWGPDDPRPPRPITPQVRAARLRALARLGVPRDRHLATLRDDRAGLNRWRRAAAWLDSNAPGDRPPWVPRSDAAPDGPGDAELRRALGRRLTQNLPSPGGGFDAACALASASVRRGERRRGPLRALRDACLENTWSCGPCLAGVSLALHELGDEDALARYAGRMESHFIGRQPYDPLYHLPIERHPDHPAMRRLRCFFGERAQWSGDAPPPVTAPCEATPSEASR